MGYENYYENEHSRQSRRTAGTTPAERSYQQRREAASRRSTEGDRAAGSQREGASRYSDRSRYSGQQRGASGRQERPAQNGQQRAGQQRQGARQRPSVQQRKVAGRGRQAASDARGGRSTQAQGQGYRSRVQYADAHWDDAPDRIDIAAYSDPSRYTASEGSYNSLYDTQHPEAVARKGNGPMVALIVIGVIVVVALLWFFVIPRPFPVIVNGKEVTMNPGATVATLVQEGHARPVPGNLVAVDGSLITTGEGEPFSATINGQAVGADTKLADGVVVEVGNGGDKTEEFTATEEVIPFPTVNDDMSFEAYWSGSIHQMSDGVDGLRTVKTGTISGKTVSEDTVPAVAGGYHNYTVQTNQPVIALTFDDGPWPQTTDQILDILEANGAKATFFTIGEQVAPYSDAVKRAHSMGCEVVTHTWDHASGSGNGVDLTLMSAEEQISEVQQGYAAIKNVLGVEPAHLLRAPGGNFHDDIIDTLWSYVDAEIGWDVDTEDWARPGVDAIAARILSVQPGQVILMHDGGGEREQTVEALRTALPTLIERGYKCVTVSELLTYNSASSQAAAGAEPGVETVELEEPR